MAYASHREPFVDVEDGWGSKGNRSSLDASFEFAERQVRQGFIRKVFGILSAQLVLTAVVTAAFVTSPGAKTFVAANPWVLWTSMLGGLATILVLACSESARRSHPTNLILLFTFTAFESVLVGLTSSMFNPQVVLLAAAVTAGVTVALTLFAMQTKYDLTMGSGVLLSLLTGLIVASVVQMFVHAPWLHLLLATGGAILFSAYLVFDVQLMMGGHRLSISPDEYVFAALNVYLDIINIFLQLLQIINELSRNQ